MNKRKHVRKFAGTPPVRCQVVTSRVIVDEFIDGKTVWGPWAYMHPTTYAEVGTVIGSKFRRINGTWYKI